MSKLIRRRHLRLGVGPKGGGTEKILRPWNFRTFLFIKNQSGFVKFRIGKNEYEKMI